MQQHFKIYLYWYPDNTGRLTIKFNGCDMEWAFNKSQERDAEFAKIAKIQIS